jgi:L-ascorbate oxidase
MAHAAMGHGSAPSSADPFYASGSGLLPAAANGGKFLSYADLKAQRPLYEHREATREIEVRLTGNMERYIWSIDGVKYEDAEPIRLKHGERVRFKFVNGTMMAHPMHLHGMWSILDVGAGKWNPIKHVISVAPGTTVYMETEVDAPGQWAFHCHLSYHAASGMFRKVVVEEGPEHSLAVIQRRTGDDGRAHRGRAAGPDSGLWCGHGTGAQPALLLGVPRAARVSLRRRDRRGGLGRRRGRGT